MEGGGGGKEADDKRVFNCICDIIYVRYSLAFVKTVPSTAVKSPSMDDLLECCDEDGDLVEDEVTVTCVASTIFGFNLGEFGLGGGGWPLFFCFERKRRKRATR